MKIYQFENIPVLIKVNSYYKYYMILSKLEIIKILVIAKHILKY